jgi:dihydrofolate reductase
MGENTLLSFPNSKPLTNRTNIVLSQDPKHNYEGVINVHTFDDFLKAMKEHSKNDVVFVIGGASIYRQTLPYVDQVYLTKVNAVGGAEVFFVNLDEHPDFELIKESEPEMDGDLEIKFTVYQNKIRLGSGNRNFSQRCRSVDTVNSQKQFIQQGIFVKILIPVALFQYVVYLTDYFSVAFFISTVNISSDRRSVATIPVPINKVTDCITGKYPV